jgi:site-specific recombinase XerD
MAERPTLRVVHLPGPDLDVDDFASIFAAFAAFMIVSGLAETTRHKYRYELLCFIVDHAYLNGIDPIHATEQDLTRYVVSLPAQGCKRGDASRALKAFYSWLDGRYRTGDPSVELKVPRERSTPAPELSDEATHRLLTAAFRQEQRRGWSMMLALETGARVSSLVAVRREDVHLEDASGPWLWFRNAKGSRPYAVPLSARGRVAVRHLLDGGHDPIVGVGAARFRQWVHAAEEAAHLDRVWPHLLRHTFASKVARSGDVEAWRRLMNHADLSQWPRYVRASDERLRSALDQGRHG